MMPAQGPTCGNLPELRRIAVAMSGGIDSSVAAAVLREQGHQVIGVTMRLRGCDEAQASRSCCGVAGLVRARAVAGQLGIRHYEVDCVREFDQYVLRPAWEAYTNGYTPNPCLPCNERIKFGILLRWAREVGAAWLATGHYARIDRRSGEEARLLRGCDPRKDQSYFLAGLNTDQLRSILFPIGHLRKSAVRELGRSLGLPAARMHESQNVCLVGSGQSFGELLRKRFGGESHPGPIVDDQGQVLGQHAGIHRFTVGQRKRLAVPSLCRRWVKSVWAQDATIVATTDVGNLYGRHLTARGVHWLGGIPQEPIVNAEVQIRYRQTAEPARIVRQSDEAVSVSFQRPVRAITPGQAVVFYDGARVLGRGWIHAPAAVHPPSRPYRDPQCPTEARGAWPGGTP